MPDKNYVYDLRIELTLAGSFVLNGGTSTPHFVNMFFISSDQNYDANDDIEVNIPLNPMQIYNLQVSYIIYDRNYVVVQCTLTTLFKHLHVLCACYFQLLRRG